MDKLFNLLVAVAVALLAFVGGAFVVLTKAFPYEHFNNAHQAMDALYHQREDYQNPYQTNLWRPARAEQGGVTVHKPAKVYNGFTLYSSSDAQRAMLIDMKGKVVHEWSLPIRKIWDDPERQLRPDGYIFWEYVHLYPNGDLIALVVGMGDTPWGYGLVKMDKDSKVIWTYRDHVHHHLDVAEDGTIYVLTNDIRDNVIPGYEHLAPPRIDDSIVALSPDGQQIKKVSILDALLRSPYGRMMRAGPSWDIKQDFLHTNSIEVVTPSTASKLPFAKAGQVLLSLRDIDTLAVLDLEEEEVVWAVRGPWHRQHDADLLSNGDILLFDNYGHYEPGGFSKIIEFDPSTLEMVWSYSGDNERFFESGIRSGQQRLPNGNTLIAESDGGRLFEVTRRGEIVWEYITPVRGGANDDLVPVLSLGMARIAPASLDPTFLANINHGKSP